MAIGGTTFCRDVILFIRDLLKNNLTDPLSTARETGSNFVVTSASTRIVNYPEVIVKLGDGISAESMGMDDEVDWVSLKISIIIKARNSKERDTITDDIFKIIRTNKYTASTGFVANKIYGGLPVGSADDDEDTGQQTLRIRILVFLFNVVSED